MLPEIKACNLKKDDIGTLFIPLCEDKSIHDNRSITALAKKAMESGEFKGEKGQELTLIDPEGIKAKRLVFVGMGKTDGLKPESLRSAAGKIVKQCMGKKLDNLWIALPSEKKTGLDTEALLCAALEGLCLSNYIYDEYKSEKKTSVLETIGIMVKAADAKKHAALPERIANICGGTLQAREWVNRPPNAKRPEQYAADIKEKAEAAGLKVTVLEEDELKEKKFGAIMAVAQGSEAPPRLVIAEYKAKGAKKTVALVGKGVTFDTGGLNLKSGAGMLTMKMDMAGSAAVAATMLTLPKLAPKVNVIGLMPIVENMPSGTATRPDDIITSYPGKTIEIGNTDAEGRLILADAMSYAIEQYKPDMMIDLATLTGACLIALGDKIAGIFTEDTKLAHLLAESGERTHERCWPMPMPEDYKEYLKSEFADTSNMSSTRAGGAITAALFLSKFAENTRWAHLDIAGPAYVKKGNAYCGPGGTGFGVRLLCEVLKNL